MYPIQRVRSGAGKLRVERTGEAAAHGYRLSTVHLPRGLGHRRVSLSATQRGFHGHPVAIGDAGPPCRTKRLEEEWTVKQTHLKAFSHLALPTPPSSNWPTPDRDSTTRAWRRGHTSRAAWDPRTCNRPVHMEGRLVHGLVSSIQRDRPKHGHATDVFPAPDADGGGRMSTGA